MSSGAREAGKASLILLGAIACLACAQEPAPRSAQSASASASGSVSAEKDRSQAEKDRSRAEKEQEQADRTALAERIEALDRDSPGELGAYVKRLDRSEALEHDASRPWYLSSTIKVPVAIVLLQEVEAGQLSLDQELTLQESDFVDDSGEIQGRAPGSKLSVRYLLDKMLTQSDSTAADMLIRLVGLDDLNAFLRRHGFGRATTLLQVRLDAHSELHPRARELTNLDYMAIKRAGGTDARLREFARRVGAEPEDLRARSIEEAFARYYDRGLNSAPLTAFGRLLEQLVEGELLSDDNTALVLRHMMSMTTGERRLKAGLPAGTPFAQKTGTQVERICNVGVIRPEDPDGIVVAACVEDFDDQTAAEALLARVGEAIAKSR